MNNISFKSNYLEYKVSSEDHRHYRSVNRDFYNVLRLIGNKFPNETAIVATFFIFPERNYISIDVKITATSQDFELALIEAYKMYHQQPLFQNLPNTP
jgi:hypothetical protein